MRNESEWGWRQPSGVGWIQLASLQRLLLAEIHLAFLLNISISQTLPYLRNQVSVSYREEKDASRAQCFSECIGQKRHFWQLPAKHCRKAIVNAEIRHRCVMFGEMCFGCSHTMGWRFPQWLQAYGMAQCGHHCPLYGAPAPGLVQLLPKPFLLIVSGARVMAGQWGKHTAAVLGSGNLLGTAQLDTTARQMCSSMCQGMANEGWRVIPSL